MAEEQTPTGNPDGASTVADAAAPAPKKQRLPRGKRGAAEAKTAPSPLKEAKNSNGRKKRAGAPSEVTPISAVKPVAAKRRRDGAVAHPAGAIAGSPSSASDEMTELLQLEEENRRLRKTLAEKLRAENADLRKKLGLV
ncbi:hypothetical protein [Sinorhizobium sp. RAC02]|uniref:hypothetical protein n=1 Tax=Sinorhizobium sp. RAC02 TaxID=1842534 RepID=UPI00083E1856|nr:hypothetical protein [Sinorhizobium sp. RAC02]